MAGIAASPRRSAEPMAANISADNIIVIGSSPISVKRKAGDEDLRGRMPAEGKENGLIEKRAKLESSKTSSLVELRGRKLVFKQDPLNVAFPVSTMLHFQLLLAETAESKSVLKEIPEEYTCLIVMAGHELQSNTEQQFIKQIYTSLSKKSSLTTDMKDLIDPETIKTLVSTLFTQQHYGFQPSDFQTPSAGTPKVPQSLQLKFWEANDPSKYFPEDLRETLESRRQDRERARREVERLLADMDDIEKMELLKPEKGGGKEKKGEAEVKSVVDIKEERENTIEASPRIEMTRKSREGTAATADSSRRSASPTKRSSKMTPEEEEAARLRREEREAKRAAREAVKAAKEEEIKKKEAIVAKQAQKMASFFKPKSAAAPKPTAKPLSNSTTAGPSCSSAVPAVQSGPSDFEKTFKPFVQRANVQWAKINNWAKEGSAQDDFVDIDVDSWTAKDFLADHLRRHGIQPGAGRPKLPHGVKSGPLFGAVSDVWQAHQDAEDPRKVLNQLKNRRKFPWKTLAFDQQARPPYCGTFSKRSVVVGPLTPLHQDSSIDYSYDSGDDWDDDEGGEDVDGPEIPGAEAEELDDEEEEDDEEGEFDDWLDDTDEGDGAFAPPSDMPDEEDFQKPNIMEQGRLPMKVVVKKRDAPKKIIKLVPYWKGPEWEKQLGSGTEGLEAYRIQLLNETPVSIDPFSYTSSDPSPSYKTTFSTTAIGVHLSVRTLLLAEPKAVEKPAPVPVVDSSKPITNGENTTSTTTASSATTATKSRLQPKIAFPQSHLPELLRLVDGNTKIQSDLVSQLKAHFEDITTKAAIEAKIKEVAIREGKSKDKIWRVKPEAWAAAGLEAPLRLPRNITTVAPTTTTQNEPELGDQPTSTPTVIVIDA